jgi:hypothetical protein
MLTRYVRPLRNHRPPDVSKEVTCGNGGTN